MTRNFLLFVSIIYLSVGVVHAGRSPAVEATTIDFSAMNLSLGMQLGAALSNHSISSKTPVTPTAAKAGFILGASLEAAMTDFIWVQPELLYIQKGSSIDEHGIATTTHLNYIDIPLFLKAKFDAKPVRPYIMAGPSIGILVSKGVDRAVNGKTATDTTFASESLDVNLVAAIGGEMDIHQNAAFFGNVRYALGVTNVSQDPDVTKRNNSFQFLIGTKFML